MLHYQKIGHGQKVMIAFHGLGRDTAMFANFSNLFPGFTIYSIALYYHESEWESHELDMDANRWQYIFENFLHDNDIERFSLIGYSMGGKHALFTYQLFRNRIDGQNLLAPYGIKHSLIEILVQRLPFFYKVLDRYVYQPDPFHKILKFAAKYQLLNPTLIKIIQKQMDTLENRFRVYHTMRLYGKIRLNLGEIKYHLETSGIPVTFYLSRYDQIITLRSLYKWVEKLDNLSLHILPGGHGSLPEKVEKILAEKAYGRFEYM